VCFHITKQFAEKNDLKMSWMPRPYKKWNIFEKRFFWLNNLGIAIMMIGSVFVLMLPTSHPFKLEIVALLMTSYAIGRTFIWNKLEKLEAQWKNRMIDPLTKEEVIA